MRTPLQFFYTWALVAAGLLLAPVALASQEQEAPPKQVTISGTAIGPDGEPAAGLDVAVFASTKPLLGREGYGKDGPPPELLVQTKPAGPPSSKLVGKAVTSEAGEFSVTVKPFGPVPNVVQVNIGDKLKTPWIGLAVRLTGEKVELGELQLHAPVEDPADDDADVKRVTISGTAIGPDGTPAAGLDIMVFALRKGLSRDGGAARPSQRNSPQILVQTKPAGWDEHLKLVGEGISDEMGSFSISFTPFGPVPDVVQLNIGDRERTSWIIIPVKLRSPTVNLGEVQLREVNKPS